MFSRKIMSLANCVRTPLVSRGYRNVKSKFPTQKSKVNVVKGNPGGNRMLTLSLDDESPDNSDITLEDIEDGENDLIDSHLLYDQHMKEMEKQKQSKSFYNIKRKYFKSNTVLPNFLTYFEKQQIKHLHSKSPKEWTPETLSTCFPAVPEVIRKILKSKWIADEGQKILRHDKLVQQNWERFRNGSFNDILSEEQKKILEKFSERHLTLITLEQAEDHVPKLASDLMKPAEFGQIITSYHGQPVKNEELKKIENKNELEKIEDKKELKTKRIYENNMKTNLKKKHFTLDEIKNNSQNNSFSWYTPQNVTINEKRVNIEEIETGLQEETKVISRKEISKFVDTINDYPLAIRIPKRVWKEGYTYRVNDCFYDDNGHFLYRVPGLISDENTQKNII